VSDFPDGFLWGSATAAHQVEGGNVNNDWWDFEHDPATAAREASGDAIDHFHRYFEDFALLSSLGHNAHRLSLEWSRIEPAPGEFSRATLAHYRRVLTAFRLPRTSDADKTARTEAIDRATRAAIDAPLDVMRLSQQALRGAVIVASNGSRKTTSDVGVAVELLSAALRGARLNVDINLAGLNDEPYTARIREEVDELVVDGAEDAERARRALQ